MVELDVVAALAAGFVATLVMTAMMTMAKTAGMTDMPPMPLVMGSMMSGDRGRAMAMAMAMGTMAHYLVMGTVVFGVGYGLVFAGLDDSSWWIGALAGIAHGLVVGLVFMPMMPLVHPRMNPDVVGVGAPAGRATVGTRDRGRVEIVPPGLLGRNWGGMTPAGLLMGHAVYGLVLALVYSWIA